MFAGDCLPPQLVDLRKLKNWAFLSFWFWFLSNLSLDKEI